MKPKFNQFKTTPSAKLYYYKYHTCIKFGPIKLSVGKPNIPKEYNGLYRCVSTQIDNNLISSKLYTSDESLINYIINDIFLSINISEIIAPINEKHLTSIQDKDINTIFRDKYWFSQYQYRVEMIPNRDVNVSENEAQELRAMIYDDFKDSRIRQTYNPYITFYRHPLNNSWPYGQQRPSTWWPPTIFTNDEEQIFLLKMRFYHLYRFKIQRITLMEDVL
jgi:hypothetical protein